MLQKAQETAATLAADATVGRGFGLVGGCGAQDDAGVQQRLALLARELVGEAHQAPFERHDLQPLVVHLLLKELKPRVAVPTALLAGADCRGAVRIVDAGGLQQFPHLELVLGALQNGLTE